MRGRACFTVKGLIAFCTWATMGVMLGHGQIGNVINNTVNTVKEPAKGLQGTAKDAAAPAKDLNKGINQAVKAPQQITKEVDKTANAFEKTANEYEKTGDNVKKLTGKGDGGGDDKSAASDSAAAKTTTEGTAGGSNPDPGQPQVEHKSAVPPDYVPVKQPAPVVVKKTTAPTDVPRPVPPGSRDNKTPSGPLPEGWDGSSTTESGTDASVVVVENNATPTAVTDGKGNDAADGKGGNTGSMETALAVDSGMTPVPDNAASKTSNGGGFQVVGGSDAGSSPTLPTETNAKPVDVPEPRIVQLKSQPDAGQRRPKPDYSYSPARIALEKADFEIETLEDLFRYSNWEGPEREHTVRAVSQSLDDLQQAIMEVKKLDPAQSTWRFEDAYRDMKAAYLGEIKRGNEAQASETK